MLMNYLKTAFRNFTRNKISTAIGLAGFTAGLIVTVLAFHFLRSEITYDRNIPQHEKIFRVLSVFDKDNFDVTALPITESLKSQLPQVIFSSHYIEKELNLRIGTRFLKHNVQFVDKDFFNIFNIQQIAGTLSDFGNTPNSILINMNVASLFFGKENPIGKIISIEIGGELSDYKIDGLLGAKPENISVQADVVVPINNYINKIIGRFRNDWLINQYVPSFYIKLNNKENKIFVEKQLYEILKPNVSQDYISKYKLRLQPITDIHFDKATAMSKVRSSDKKYSLIMIALSVLIMLIVSINYANLVIAKSLSRSKEIGIRKTIGALRKDIIAQFIIESIVMVSAAFILAVIFSLSLQPFFQSLLGEKISFNLSGNPSTLILISIIISFAIIIGLIPAIKISKYPPQTIFRDYNIYSGSKYVSNIFIGIQFAIAIFLLFGAIVLNYQYSFMTNKNLGYNGNNMIMIKTSELFGRNLNGETVNNYRNDIRTNPMIRNAGIGSITLGGKEMESMFRFDFEDRNLFSYLFGIDADLLQTLDLKLIEGENFDEWKDNSKTVIISKTFAERLRISNPINNYVSFYLRDKEWRRIIGVVKDFHYRSLKDSIAPVAFYYTGGKKYSECIYAKIGNSDVQRTISFLKERWGEYFPGQAFDYQFLDEKISNLYTNENRWKNIINYLSISSVLFVCMGLFGLVLFSTQRRTKEIGIRKVFGASIVSIVKLLLAKYLWLILISFIIGVIPAYYLSEIYLQDFAYRIGVGVLIFVITAGIIFTITLLTVGIKTIKAANANPVESLRYE